ncbi:hypothetical protein ACFC0C_28350 [Streptomyces sp. NPDC056178]|uniref:hypothetical protein n=1 Tax=unclassified Streptomyces TaxID=2593676 RepID=UPI0035D98E6A
MSELLDGSGAILGFLGAWYGPPDRPADTEIPGADRLPPALREWYAITSQYIRPVLFNHKVFPADQVCEYDGVLEFCMDDFEYQQFGVALGDADPVVLQRVVSSDDLWEPWGLTLSQFLHALLVHETTQGARHAAAADQLTSDQVEYLLAPLRKMSGPQLFTTHYVGEGLLATAWPSTGPEGCWTVQLAARTDGLLTYAESLPGVKFGPGEWCPNDGLTAPD